MLAFGPVSAGFGGVHSFRRFLSCFLGPPWRKVVLGTCTNHTSGPQNRSEGALIWGQTLNKLISKGSPSQSRNRPQNHPSTVENQSSLAFLSWHQNWSTGSRRRDLLDSVFLSVAPSIFIAFLAQTLFNEGPTCRGVAIAMLTWGPFAATVHSAGDASMLLGLVGC